MVEIVKHFTTDEPDSEGRFLVGHNEVLGVFYHNTEGDDWRRDWSGVVNPFVNHDFSEVTITGTGPFDAPGPGWYETGTEATILPPTYPFLWQGRIPLQWEEDLFAEYGTIHEWSTSGPSVNSVNESVGSWWINASVVGNNPPRNVFPTNYSTNWDDTEGWATSSGILGADPENPHSPGPGFVTLKLDPPQEVAGFYALSFEGFGVNDSESMSGLIGEYEFQIATSGTGLGVDNPDFITVASGVNPPRWVSPIWEEITPTLAQYVRIVFWSVPFTTSVYRTHLRKFRAFSKETIDKGMCVEVSAIQNHNSIGSGGRVWSLKQDVNLTGTDWIYVDYKDFTEASYTAEFYIDGVKVFEIFKTRQIAGTSGETEYFGAVRGAAIDVESHIGTKTFEVRKQIARDNESYLGLGKVYTTPGWFDEGQSATRGSQASFPNEVVFSVDRQGMSVIDVSIQPGENEISPRLWMRFDMAERKMLQRLPRKVVGKNGRFYLATSTGMFVLDFPGNRMARWDWRGIWFRYGVDYRNVRGWAGSENGASPARTLLDYHRIHDTPQLLYRDIYDIALGTAEVFGDFVVFGTSTGLVLWDGKLDSSTVHYVSKDHRPVRHVTYAAGKLWYVQGRGRSTSIHYVDDIDNITTSDFEPDKIYHQNTELVDDLSGVVNAADWEILNEDPSMSISEGEVLTISGTHTRGGATGIISKHLSADKSFVAKVKARIIDFPAEAFGAVRFGLSFNYHAQGHRDLYNSLPNGRRTGVFVSALNTDPVGGWLPEDFPLDLGYWPEARGWWFAHQDRVSGDIREPKAVHPVDGETLFRAPGRHGFGGPQNLLRLNTTVPMLARDFSVRLDVQPQAEFQAIYSNGYDNGGAWLGTTTNWRFLNDPNLSGNRYIPAAMMAGSAVTFSGIPVYTTGYINSAGNAYPTFVHGTSIPFETGEESGGQPFREWHMAYNAAQGSLQGFVDGVYCGTEVGPLEVVQPPRYAITVGMYCRIPGSNEPELRMAVKNLRITYPAPHIDSSYKYSLETSDGYQGFSHTLGHHTTYSGISLIDDTDPATSTLGGDVGLSNGDLTGGGFFPVLDGSFGVALSGTGIVEALHLYDAEPTTDGWFDTTSKQVEVWRSDDNVSWSFIKAYDLNRVARTEGVTKLNFTPGMEGKFFKAKLLDATINYRVPSSDTWALSEVRAMTLSGIDFMPNDASAAADFHEWRLDYDADTRIATAYIDDVFISETYVSDSLNDAQFILAHDLTPVTSGTSTFHGEFKDLEITFPGTGFVSPGDISDFSVNANPTAGGRYNHTLFTASTSGVGVADVEIGAGVTLPDSFQFFDADDTYFGEADNARTLFADGAAQRDTGLVFVGTSPFVGTSHYELRYGKVDWLERAKDPGGGADERYGGRVTFGYHPGADEIFEGIGRNTNYWLFWDMDKGTTRQVSRAPWLDTFLDPGGLTSDWQGDSAKARYRAIDDRMWVLAPSSLLIGTDVNTGAATRYLIGNSPTQYAQFLDNDANHNHFAYIPHNDRFVWGTDYLMMTDAATGDPVLHPRNWNFGGHGSARWNRYRSIVPWDETVDGGHAEGIYVDYDKSVYFVGSTSANTWTNNRYFYQYHVDKDYLELITLENPHRVVWPHTDEEWEEFGVTPMRMLAKAAWFAYDPINLRLYASSESLNNHTLFYFDLLERKWVDTGEPSPQECNRQWPNGTGPSDSAHDACHVIYRSSNHSLVFMGRPDDPEVLEYRLERDPLVPKFEYLPSRDGLPFADGRHRQYTVGGAGLESEYTASTQWTRDFYKGSTHDTLEWDYSFSPDGVITISGSQPGDLYSFKHRARYSSSLLMESERSFDISAKIALPKFTRNIYEVFGVGGDRDPECWFSLGVSDGLNHAWIDNNYGEPDPNYYQEIAFRVGVSGVLSDPVTEYPLRGHIFYSDGENTENTNNPALRIVEPTKDTYLTDGVDWAPTTSGDFLDVRLSYDFDTDTAEAFLDGQSAGTMVLKRKLNPAGSRFFIEHRSESDSDALNDHQWVIQMKDLKVTPKAFDRIERGRLITSISGSTGSYYHERWDTTITSGVDWVYEIENYLPTYRRWAGYDYLASMAAIGDGHKLAELVAFIGPGQKKQMAFTGDPGKRNDRTTYLGTFDYQWDDIDIGKYRLVKDTAAQTVSVYTNDAPEPASVVDYQALPSHKYQHTYYGKVHYDTGEEQIVAPTSLSGSWGNTGNMNGSFDPSPGKRRWMDDAQFAKYEEIDQVSPLSEATYFLPSELGVVDMYVFYPVHTQSVAISTPYTVVASGIVSLPPGDQLTLMGIETNTDQYGDFSPSATTIRIDQRRNFYGDMGFINKNKLESSGWVYLGTYRDPEKVIVTPRNAQQNPTGQFTSWVIAGAVGVNVGVRPRSTFDMSVSRVRYYVGRQDIPIVPVDRSGLTVIDLEDKKRIDFYGDATAPSLQDANITTGEKFE